MTSRTCRVEANVQPGATFSQAEARSRDPPSLVRRRRLWVVRPWRIHTVRLQLQVSLQLISLRCRQRADIPAESTALPLTWRLVIDQWCTGPNLAAAGRSSGTRRSLLGNFLICRSTRPWPMTCPPQVSLHALSFDTRTYIGIAPMQAWAHTRSLWSTMLTLCMGRESTRGLWWVATTLDVYKQAEQAPEVERRLTAAEAELKFKECKVSMGRVCE